MRPNCTKYIIYTKSPVFPSRKIFGIIMAGAFDKCRREMFFCLFFYSMKFYCKIR